MYRRFGAAVTIERSERLVAHEDADFSDAIRGILEDEGIAVRTGAECLSFAPAGGGEDRKFGDRIPGYALYIDPPLGRVGMTEAQVVAAGRPVLVSKRPMVRVGRAIERDETKGFMKVVVDAGSQKILGAAILGTGGGEAIHGIMSADQPASALCWAVPIHPIVSELIPTLLVGLGPVGKAR